MMIVISNNATPVLSFKRLVPENEKWYTHTAEGRFDKIYILKCYASVDGG
jgi:hypothetical protein